MKGCEAEQRFEWPLTHWSVCSGAASATKAPAKKAAGGEGKVSKVNDSKAPGVIMEYMAAQNRPFNAIMLQQNLHGAVSKAQATKFLEQLASQGKLSELVNKKQKIYWINQDELECVDGDALKDLDREIKELREEDEQLKRDLEAREAQIKQTEATPTNAQLDVELPETEKRYLSGGDSLPALT